MSDSTISWLEQIRAYLANMSPRPEPPPQPAAPQPRRLGLALGGGGGKGTAHIGVLQVLEELDVPIDLVVGSSAGGAVAVLYAAGLSFDQI
ncbi:MAG TPA: patatin-like phospholipase family protein, partial [Chloroflexaceae bacterium]|nr:patatin-like phospholipase family protein [Chloroflexaceae bacterium]